MIIEFFGFPGSGKTTISDAFIDTMKRENIHVVRGTFDHFGKVKRIFSKILFSCFSFFYNPVFFINNIVFFSKNRSLSDFLNISYLFGRYCYFAKSKKTVVFDQGLAQAYLSVYSFTKEGKEYNASLLFQKIKKIIILKLDFNRNKRRLFDREDQSSRVQKNRANIEEFWMTYGEFEKQLIMQLNANQVLEINSRELVGENVQEIGKWLNF